MNGLPDSYLSALNLPFNRDCLDARFRLKAPDQDPGGPGCWLILQGNRLLVGHEPGSAVTLPEDANPYDRETTPLYIGQWDDRPCRLVVLEHEAPLPEKLTAVSFMDQSPRLPIELLTLAGLGRMILHWEQNSQFCAGCGQPMTRLPGEWGKNCPTCKAHHFPHIHPCAIVLVRRPGEVLLTRKPEWAPNRYSLVAGFTEFGECLEETAAREVSEETGIVVRDIRYLGSQCWPFPSQLMCGFVAEYAGGELRVDRSELEDARWFRLDALPMLPPKRSIARHILDTALKSGD